MLRNNILLQRLPNPRRVHLPNGRVFFAKYQRVNKHTLAPTQVRIARTYVRKIGPRQQRIRRISPRNRQSGRQQTGAGLIIATAIDLGKRTAGSELGKMVINDAIDYIPTAYKKTKNKMTNKKVKTVMETGVDDYLVNRGVELIGERLTSKICQGVYLILRLKKYLKK